MAKAVVESGEFAGWSYWDTDPFEYEAAGPFYFRKEDGVPVSAFRVAHKHLNGHDIVHGGCLLSFADFALFSIALDALGEDGGVTVSLNSEFLHGVGEGAFMEARGDVLRAGGSLIFVRGIITGNGVPCLNFSGTIKRLRKRG